LLASGAKVTAIELDKRLAEYLHRTISNPNFKLIIGDACRINLAELFPCEFRIVANLPYSISSPFIADTLQIETPPTEMIFMLQKETGMRLSSGPGTKNYGALSVTVQAVYNVEYLRTVSPQVFFPVPDVESAILKFTRKKDYLPLAEREVFRNLVRTGFSQRRKKMFKQISAIFDPGKITAAMNALNISKDVRAEELTVKQFVALSKML
jgi:16S rRNA (adenine1518-N6/adenine1519-N6)-dimethyltransferase